jgi:hypothetical protein
MPSPEHYAIFNCFMTHISTNPAVAAPSALVQAAFVAAEAADDTENHFSGWQEAEAHAGAILRQLLLAAAQQDAAATAAAVQDKLQSPPDNLDFKLLSCVVLDLWLCADAELAASEAQWPAVQQQMLSTVAKARHEPQEGDEAAALPQ